MDLDHVWNWCRNIVICHNGTDVIHCVHVKQGNVLVTGQPIVEQFDTLEEAKLRINEIANDESYFDSNFNPENM